MNEVEQIKNTLAKDNVYVDIKDIEKAVLIPDEITYDETKPQAYPKTKTMLMVNTFPPKKKKKGKKKKKKR